MSSAARRHLARIYQAAVAAVDPFRLVSSYLGRHAPAVGEKWTVVGAGKAAARMAAGCEDVLGERIVGGTVITADDCGWPLERIDCRFAGHPLPDERGTTGAADLCERLTQSSARIIALISGGASALLVRPAPPITLEEKVRVNDLLLRHAAAIEEVNCVRKHLSLVKGGGLLRYCGGRPVLTLILSDVLGDDPSVIGSGPTVADPTTFADALNVLRRLGVEDKVPPSIRQRLLLGQRGEIAETVKDGDPVVRISECVILGNNLTALAAAAAEAQKLGYNTLVTHEPLTGDTRVAARDWLKQVRHVADRRGGERWCVITGGETTVEVLGSGRGGRNQEFALALLEGLQAGSIHVLSAGTDGIDGPTDAAGAFVDGQSMRRARHLGVDPTAALAQNDSYGFFGRMQDLFAPGATGTNVADIKIALG